MEEQESTQIVQIPSPWRDVLLQAISQVQEDLFIICPYIKEEVVTALKTTLQAGQETRQASLRVRVITRVNGDELLAGSSDLSALQQLLRWPRELSGSSVELCAIPNIHTKVWIIDDARAIVGSGNTTPSGLDENLEYGLAVTDPAIVARVRQDWELWWEQAPVVNEQQLEQMQDWLTRSSQLLQEIEDARREIVRTVGPSPRVGQRLSPRSRHLPPSRPATPSPAFGHLAETRQTYTPLEKITVSPAYMLAALRWIYPFPLSEITPPVVPSAQEFIKLNWNRDAQQLTFTWANGQRRSEASIPAQGGDTGSSWAVTINLSSAHSLTQELAVFNRLARWGGSAMEATQLSLYSFGANWSLDTQLKSTYSYSFSVTQTNPPSVFPHLQAPISRLTGVDPQVLRDMLAHHSASATGTWLRLARSGSSVSLTFSDNSLENPEHLSLPATQSQLAGLPIALQFATADLQQVLREAPEVVNQWSIEIDRDAKAMQLVPETDNEVIGGWRHHLWPVGE